MRLMFALLLAVALLAQGCVQVELEDNSEPLFKYTRVPVSPAVKNLTNSSVSDGTISNINPDGADSNSNDNRGYHSNTLSGDGGSSEEKSDSTLKWQYDLSEDVKGSRNEDTGKSSVPMGEVQTVSFEIASPTSTPNSKIWNSSEADFLEYQQSNETYSGPYVEYKGAENNNVWDVNHVAYADSGTNFPDYGDGEDNSSVGDNQTEGVFNGTDDDGIQGYEYANFKEYSWE